MSTSTKSLFKKLLLPLTIVAITAALLMFIFDNPPTSKRFKQAKTAQMTVETKVITPQTYQVNIQSFGTVKPRTQSVLFAQVSGQINSVSEQFRDGGFFEKGDVLIQLDDRDHKAEVNIATASLMSAKQQLQEEVARGKQAAIDWERLGKGKTPNELVLRKPQLEAAKAAVMSAQAQFDKVNLSLERTKIVAPYAGRILKKNVDIGQVISSNTQLADIYAADTVEVRLPIKNKDLPLITLPEEYRTSSNAAEVNRNFNRVEFSSDLMGAQSWNGTIIRTESAIDSVSQQLYVVGQIDSPFDENSSNSAQIKIGQYVTAVIKGKALTNVIVIPSSAIYQGSYVYTVENNVLLRKEIQLSWQNGSEAIVSSGLNANDELVLTSLGQVSSGTPVAINGKTPKAPKRGKKIDGDKRKKLEKIAAEKGITVEELIAERKNNRVKKS